MARRSLPRKGHRDEIVPPERTASLWAPPWAWGLLLIVAAGLWTFAAVRGFQFVNWDDGVYVTSNPVVLNGVTWNGVVWSFSAVEPYWHPLTWWSHMLDVSWFGAEPGAHHVVSLVVHLCNAVLVAWVLTSLTGRPGRALVAAAVFAVHPLHVESVAWIAERKDLLSTFFMLLAVRFYADFARSGRRTPYAGLLVCFAATLMAKPMFVTLPVLLLVLDWWPLGRWREHSAWTLVREKLPLLAAAAAVSVVTFVAQARVGTMARVTRLPLGDRAAHATLSYLTYIRQTLWPSDLAAFYPYPTTRPWIVAAIAAFAILAAATAAAVRLHRRPYLAMGWLWFLISLLPVIGLVQVGNQSTADRFMYAPMLGLLVIAVWGAGDLAERFGARGRQAAAAAAVVLLAGYAVAARAQVRYWADSETLWRRVLSVSPGSYYAHSALGEALADRGDLTAARREQEDALRIRPDDPDANNELGRVLGLLRDFDPAIEHFNRALAASPEFVEARRNLARAHHERGATRAERDPAAALADLEAAVENDPATPEFRVTLALAYLALRRPAEARPHVMEAMRLDPSNQKLRELLALVDRASGGG